MGNIQAEGSEIGEGKNYITSHPRVDNICSTQWDSGALRIKICVQNKWYLKTDLS